MQISFITPARNNRKYLEWSYTSIRKNQGNHTVEVCIADDASTDGTWEWCQEISKIDSNFKCIRNEGPSRKGHTVLYDELILNVASYELVMIMHADMYLCPGALDEIEKYMYTKEITVLSSDYSSRRSLDMNNPVVTIPNYKTIVSLTRIEPPLHPPGPEKILADFGTEPEEFNEDKFLEWYTNTGFLETYVHNNEDEFIQSNGYSHGIFAPWACFKKDFLEIGGHDQIYRPQSAEDSSIFNRFKLNGCKFIQTRLGHVYHMTCRGNRRNVNDGATDIYTDNPEWSKHSINSHRTFCRMWGCNVRHDKYMEPIIPHKYNIGIVLKSPNFELIKLLEPYCDDLYLIDTSNGAINMAGMECDNYIKYEQPNTYFDLIRRVHYKYDLDNLYNDIILYIDSNNFNQNDYQTLYHLPEILDGNLNGEIGKFEISNFLIDVRRIVHYETHLIHSNNRYLQSKLLVDEFNHLL